MDSINILKNLFISFFGSIPTSIDALPQAGSDRRYWRLAGSGHSAIGTFGPDIGENRCFIGLAGAFKAAGIVAVPEIYAVAEDETHYLQEDLGSVSLFDLIHSEDAEGLIRETLDRLVSLQQTPEKKLEKECRYRPFSKRQIFWDLNYFKYEYLKPSGITYDEERLEDDFELLASRLMDIYKEWPAFMMRDCQSRNVMMSSKGPVFIDFQGGRRGPALYDAISFLWQARAGFSPDFRRKMLIHYANRYCREDDGKVSAFLSGTAELVLFRTLQVLGAYGFRGLVQQRAHFILSIPGALRNLRELLDDGNLDRYPELKKVSTLLISDIRFADKTGRSDIADRKRLNVEVFSFSYKKGYPADYSGNGGGFMFDCRAMHNPGRYAEYRHLTGRDKAVIDFLEKRGEVFGFLNSAWSMVDPAVERYIQRGFSNLQIGFGCTGGQHRSVFCAEHTARHLKILFPEANVILTHREHPSK